jgi:hypothetical protein
MECRQKQRLAKAFFDAVMEQRAIMEKVQAIRASGSPRTDLHRRDAGTGSY